MSREWSPLRSRLIRRLAEVDGFESDAVIRRAAAPATRDGLPVDAVLMSLGVAAGALED